LYLEDAWRGVGTVSILDCVQAARQLKEVFIHVEDPSSRLIEDLTRYSVTARRSGLMALDSELESIEDPFLRKALTLAVDGTIHPSYAIDGTGNGQGSR